MDLGRLLVPKSEFAEYAKSLEPDIDALLKEKPHLTLSAQRELERIGERTLVEAGPDLYVVNEKLEITEVIRNWMLDFKGSPGSTK